MEKDNSDETNGETDEKEAIMVEESESSAESSTDSDFDYEFVNHGPVKKPRVTKNNIDANEITSSTTKLNRNPTVRPPDE